MGGSAFKKILATTSFRTSSTCSAFQRAKTVLQDIERRTGLVKFSTKCKNTWVLLHDQINRPIEPRQRTVGVGDKMPTLSSHSSFGTSKIRYLICSATKVAYLGNRLSMALFIGGMNAHSRNSGQELVQIDCSWEVEARARRDHASVPTDGSESPPSHAMHQSGSGVLDGQGGTPGHVFV